jgi:hypothetical protein
MENKFWYSDGTCSYNYCNNKILHRLDGPAVELADGNKAWYMDGKRHRLDGPAYEYADGSKQWWVEDKWINEEGEFEKHPLRIQYLIDKQIEEEIMRLLNEC